MHMADMLDEGNRFLYASLVACALARRLRDREIIQSIIETGVSSAPEVERAMYATESVSASSDDEHDIAAADPRCVGSVCITYRWTMKPSNGCMCVVQNRVYGEAINSSYRIHFETIPCRFAFMNCTTQLATWWTFWSAFLTTDHNPQ